MARALVLAAAVLAVCLTAAAWHAAPAAAGSLETGSGAVAEDVFQTYICELTDAGSPVWFDWWPAAAVARCDPADMALSGGSVHLVGTFTTSGGGTSQYVLSWED